MITALAGCMTPIPPAQSRILETDSWDQQQIHGSALVTPHYLIYTTLTNHDYQEDLAALMEGALREYASLAPVSDLPQRKLVCYVFATRDQWADFTRNHTGGDAAVYLHIGRGGYTAGDWFVLYNIGPSGTFSVAAHEGFHQFAARNFKTRIPPFLEEGLACMFESLQWQQSQPTWNLADNPARVNMLRTAIRSGEYIPLDELVRMHAGQIVQQPRARIAAFYGESWAFAEFLWTGNRQRHRAQLQKLLIDAENGTLDGIPRSVTGSIFWNPATAKPLLVHYLGADLSSIEAEFRIYIQQLIDDPLPG